jgi:4-amino-4-deoxy-L-arabinose transferase-like glycosyltransferase
MMPFACLGIGAALMLLALGMNLVAACKERRRERGRSDSVVRVKRRPGWLALGFLAIIVSAGVFLRIDGLATKSLTHPEVYVPGIDLPADISEPPPRHTFAELVWWHFHDEWHPQGYYLFMWGWTKLFGTGLFALRLPSALLGAGSIILVFCAAWMVYDALVGSLSAALLAFNGHQIYWSQEARMYALVCFLGLASTVLLLQLANNDRRKPLRELAYVVVCFLGVLTEIVFWPFLAAQIVWTMACRAAPGKAPPRLVYLQALVICLGSPLWAHAVYRSHPSFLGRPTITFVAEYLSFGFLFERDVYSATPRAIPALLLALLAGLAVVCILRGLFVTCQPFAAPLATGQHRMRPLVWATVGAVLFILGMSLLARHRGTLMILTVAVPLAALIMPDKLQAFWNAWICRGSIQREAPLADRPATGRPNGIRSWAACLQHIPGRLSPLLFLALIPSLLLSGISFVTSLAASRVFLMFTPYLLVLSAVGLAAWARRPLLVAPVGIALAVLVGMSVIYYREYPSSPRDYQELGQKLRPSIKDGDLIFVHNRSWRTTPIFYFLQGKHDQLVAADLCDAARRHPAARIWVVQFAGEPATPEMNAALSGYCLQRRVTAPRAAGLLYMPASQLSSTALATTAGTGQEP